MGEKKIQSKALKLLTYNMYNFLDGRLLPNVITKCPVMDGYEANNLISEIIHIKSKGFLAFSAIKPPIDIDFELICPIKIHYISVWTAVGSQKSNGFEIYAKSNNYDYQLIGKIFTASPGFAMCNRKICSVKKPQIPDDFETCYFKASEYRTFNCANKIRIKIIRTLSSVPCIGQIEIWGQIAASCTEKTKKTINYLMKPKTNIPPIISEPSTSKITQNYNFEIPKDFIDDISCDVMSIPMTLPCGKTVDQSTLEKHAESESKWGRGPSDPFTGLSFTETHKPKLNTFLKNRIDDFLLKNKDRVETKYVQRTLGKSKAENRVPDYAVVTESDSKMIKLNNDNPLQSTSSDNLDLAIEQTLTKYNITRYSKIDNNSTQIKIDICGFCKNEDNLYVLQSCKHLICRQCLVNVRLECVCKICKITFCKKDVYKHHP